MSVHGRRAGAKKRYSNTCGPAAGARRQGAASRQAGKKDLMPPIALPRRSTVAPLLALRRRSTVAPLFALPRRSTVALLLALATGCASAPPPPAPGPGGPSPRDQAFLATAAAAGLAEVKFAELAAGRSQNHQVQDLAHTLLADFAATNQALDQVAAARGLPLPADLDSTGRRDYRALDRLSEHRDFDRYYVNLVAEYHVHAVRRFRGELRHTADPDLRRFAAATLRVLERDRDLAQGLVPNFGHGRTYGGDTPQ
jgi:putative membrane protein